MFRSFQACYEGSYKVVELLLEEGVEKDTKNRWRNTPLEEAISSRYPRINLPALPPYLCACSLYYFSTFMYSIQTSPYLAWNRCICRYECEPVIHVFSSSSCFHFSPHHFGQPCAVIIIS
jgi:hypothetical protein